MRKKIILCAILLCLYLNTSSDAMSYIAEPVLVTQPVYSGMSFYVYRPYNMPAGWFATYDGYPVMRTQGGSWIYGIPCAGGFAPSGYIVGSVIPTAVPTLIQVQQRRQTIVQNVPQQPYMQRPAQIPANTIMVAPVAPQLVAAPIPRWLTDNNFTVVARWSRVVDRLAVLNKPRMPLAWKGDKPEAVYAWTGKSWFQMKTRTNESPADTLKRNVYVLTRMKKQNHFMWNDSDTPLLASQAPVWGYLWMGLIAPINF